MKKKKCQITFYFIFLVLSIIIIMIGSLAAPLGALFSAKMYQAGENILFQTNDSINGISDPNVKASVQGVIAEATANTENNINVATALFKYSWVFLLLVTGIMIFLLARSIVETGGTGGFI